MVVVSLTCLFIAALGLRFGEKNITRSDWCAFLGALLAIPIWLATSNPFWALLLIIAIDVMSYYPTIRKSWHAPWAEPAQSYFWAGFRYFLMLFAVPDATLQNLTYPLILMACDWGFVLFLLWRRKHSKE
jgi:hypothetical protein